VRDFSASSLLGVAQRSSLRMQATVDLEDAAGTGHPGMLAA